jgi:SAM-dependent methyltransferase
MEDALQQLGDDDPFATAKNVFEFGCGTGDGLHLIHETYPGISYLLGIDISSEAIDAAKKLEDDKLAFSTYDCSTDAFRCFRKFDLTLSSNVLEHFSDPHPLIDGLLSISDMLVLIVPYDHHEFPKNEEAYGTIQHVSVFNEDTMSEYEIVFERKFKSSGWKHVTKHKDPKQWILFVTGKEN